MQPQRINSKVMFFRTLSILFFIVFYNINALASEAKNINCRASAKLTTISPGSNINLERPTDAASDVSIKRIAKSDFKVYLNRVGNMADNKAVNLFIDVKYVDGDGNIISGLSEENVEIPLDGYATQGVYFKELTQFERLYKIDQIEVTVRNYQTLVPGDFNIVVEYDIDYALSVSGFSGVSLPPIANKSTITVAGSKDVYLNWEHYYPYTLYELQLLKVAEINVLDKSSLQNFSPNWNNALIMHVPVNALEDAQKERVNFRKQLKLSLLGGSGSYLWRVRAIGNYYEGGTANVENFGDFRHSIAQKSITLNAENQGSDWFYFNDPDDGKNVIQSRIFVEENKTKEIKTYADGLHNERQSQVYLESKGVTIISQKILDKSGRSSLNLVAVPVSQKKQEFVRGHVRTEDGATYTADDFDDDPDNPSTVKEEGTLSYYNNNTDPRIPNSEGYPFSRTVYYNDPLHRVKEQSAPGATFALQSAANKNNSHTLRYYYGTASDNELVRLLGNDAPNGEKVSKTTVVDQNNIASVTYTDLSGNVIATSLAYNEADLGNLQWDGSAISSDVTDIVTSNIKTSKGFYSSKRMFLAETQNVIFDYRVKAEALESNCASLSADCNFTLEIIATNIDTEVKTTIKEKTLVKTGTQDDFVSEGSWKRLRNPKEQELPSGNYIIEKFLYPGDAQLNIAAAESSLLSSFEPLLLLLEHWYDMVDCNTDAAGYYSNLNALRTLVNNEGSYTSFNPTLPFTLNEEWAGFAAAVDAANASSNFSKDKYTLTFYQGDNVMPDNVAATKNSPPDYCLVSYGECCQVPFKAKWIEHFPLNVDSEVTLHQGGYKFTVDFEQYAKNYLNDCNGGKIYKYMEGWETPGTLNFMVHKMLTDIYTRKNPIEELRKADLGIQTINANSKLKFDQCGNAAEIDCEGDDCYKYELPDLFNCFEGALSLLRNDLGCADFTVTANVQSRGNLMEAVDEEEEGLNQDATLDNSVNIGGLFRWVLKWYMKRQISKQLRDNQPTLQAQSMSGKVESDVHLVKEFLNCTGYQFAKIITPYDPLPLSGDRMGGFNYLPNNGKYQLARYNGSYFNVSDIKPYVPLAGWNPKKVKIVNGKRVPIDDEPLFEHIKNPIYAFKYFEYPYHGQQDYIGFENQFCFEDPNDGYLPNNAGTGPDVDRGTFTIKREPVCVSKFGDDPNTYNFKNLCYKDFNYPYLEYLEPELFAGNNNERRYGSENGERYRYVVRDFMGIGRMQCPYNYLYWSSGQRYTFYQGLVNKAEFTEEDEDSDANKLRKNKYGFNSYFETCDSVAKQDEWYYQTRDDGSRILHKKGKSDYFDMQRWEKVANFEGEGIEKTLFKGLLRLHALILYENWDTLKPHEYNQYQKVLRPQKTFSVVEREMHYIEQNCTTKCNRKRDVVRKEVIEALEEGCYDIGFCYSAYEPWVVPDEDVEKMVDKIIANCMQHCPVNTYGCRDVSVYRDPNSMRHIPGRTIDTNYNHVYPHLYFGIAGYPRTDDYYKTFEQGQLYNNQLGQDLNGDGKMDIIRYEVYDKDGYNDLVLDQFSWYEYTSNQQGEKWIYEIEFPSYCEEKNRRLVLYGTLDPSNRDDNDIPEKSENWDNTSEDHFIPRSAYEIPKGLKDQNNVEVGDDVKSGAVKLELNVPVTP